MRKEKSKEREVWLMYHVPSMSNIHRIKKNAIFISTSNSIEHEIEKLKICYELKKKGHSFITEAELNKTKNVKGIRRDVVDLTTGIVYEIETDEKSIKRKKIEQKEAKDYNNVVWIKI